MSEGRLKIGITQGDTNGIGWEVILKVLSDARLCEICTPVVYGSRAVADYYRKSIKDIDNVSFNIVKSAAEARADKVNIVECGAVKQITPGVASAEAGLAAVAALECAVADLKSGVLDGVVTAPFNKESVQSEEFNFTGHTEYMAAQFAGESMMMMCSERLKVGLVTKHLPLSEVAGAITKEAIVKDLLELKQTLISDFSIVAPRIAVLALNPHAGDGGLLGREEQQIITPAINESYAQGVYAFGPFAADGFFSAGTYAKYDAVLAIYHDQGLIPFKTLSPEGVNFTAGLEGVRTSPDHGVAYDIAGKDQANPDSMRNAIYMVIDVVKSRRKYKVISANPLEHVEMERERGDRGSRPPRGDRGEGRDNRRGGGRESNRSQFMPPPDNQPRRESAPKGENQQ